MGGPVAAAGEGEESPHRVRPGLDIADRGWGHSPETSGHLPGHTVMADGPGGLVPEPPVCRFNHHMQQVKEGTIWREHGFEGDSFQPNLIVYFNSVVNLLSSTHPPN